MLKLKKTGKAFGLMRGALLLLVFACVFPFQVQAFEVKAHVDVNRITQGESVQLRVEVEGGKADPDLSMIRDFKVIPRGTSSSMNYINGKLDRKSTYQYLLVPLKTGQLEIPSIRVSRDGETVFSAPIRIQVTEQGMAADPSHPEKSPLFATAELSKPAVFAGEQAVYTLKFYTSKKLGGAGFETPPGFEGLSVTPLGDDTSYLTTIEGVQFQVTRVDYILSSRTPGIYKITPAILSAKVRVQNQRNPGFDPFFNDPFFSSGSYKPVRVTTNPVELEVTALPPYPGTKPFSGLIGEFEISAELDQMDIKAGESATLTVRISGNGNIMDAGQPNLNLDENAFKAYADNPVESVEKTTNGFEGYKIFKTALVPYRAGRYAVQPVSVVVFDVARKEYRELRTSAFEIAVQPSGNQIDALQMPQAADPPDSGKIVKKEVRFQNKDIFDIRENFHVLENRPPFPTSVFLSLLAAPLLLLFCLRGAMKARKRPAPVSKQMAEKARYHIRMASRKDPSDDAFLSHLYTALVSAVLSRAGRKGETVTREEVRSIMTASQAGPETADRMIQLFDTIESIRFGASRTDENRAGHLLADARKLVKKMCAGIMLVACLLPFQGSAEAQPAVSETTIFTQGISLYRSGDFEAAAVKFEHLAENGIVNPDLYYNIGNAYLKAGQIGYAVLWYQRARLLAPGDPDLAFNLGYAQDLVQDKLENTMDVSSVLFFWRDFFSLRTLQGTTILCFFLFSGWAVWRTMRSRPVFSAVGTVLAGLCIIAALICFDGYYIRLLHPQAVIVVSRSAAYSGNSESATHLFDLHEGSRVTIQDHRKGWIKVVFSDRKAGWIQKADAERI